MAWRFLAFDLLSQAFLAELPVQSWASSDPLTGSGQWSASVELDGRAATSTTSRRAAIADSTRRGRTVVVAERDGVEEFSGIIWRRRYSARNRLIEIAGAGLGSYFDHHAVTSQLGPYAAVDQLAIFRAFVDHVQARPASDIGIITHVETSGVLRDRSDYPAYSGKKIGALMAELAAVQDGFDFTFGVEYSAGAVERHCRLFYPRRGRPLSQTGLRFYAPGNAVLFDVDEDGSDMATTIVELGAGDGFDMLTTSASQTDLIAAGWPGFIDTYARKDVTVLATLAEHAAADVARRSGVDAERFTVQVDPTSVGQPYGSWTLGDDAMLVVADDPFYPGQDDGSPGLAIPRRVVQHDWRIESSSEELFVTLGERVIP